MPTPLNPYIAGNPVGDGAAFIGRDDVLQDIVSMLADSNENALILYGERRTGKTSVLLELAAHLPTKGPYHPVSIDLQDKSTAPLEKIIEDLATRIIQELNLSEVSPNSFETPQAFRNDFLPLVLAQLAPKTSLVLLFDEVDVLDNLHHMTFFSFLGDLISFDAQILQFIFATGHRPEDLSSLTLPAFEGVRARHISFFSQEETAELVRLSERNETLIWPEEIVTQVWVLTGGHPFLTQQLCSDIWDHIYEDDPKERPIVQLTDVTAAIPLTLGEIGHVLQWLWEDRLKQTEQVVISALAEISSIVITQEELDQVIYENNVRIPIRELRNVPSILQAWDLIEMVDGGYRFRLVDNHQHIVGGFVVYFNR